MLASLLFPPPQQKDAVVDLVSAEKIVEALNAYCSQPVASLGVRGAKQAAEQTQRLSRRVYHVLPEDELAAEREQLPKVEPVEGSSSLRQVVSTGLPGLLLARDLSCSCSACFAGDYGSCGRRRQDGGHVAMPWLRQLRLSSASTAEAGTLRTAIRLISQGDVFAQRALTDRGYELLEACKAPVILSADSGQHAKGSVLIQARRLPPARQLGEHVYQAAAGVPVTVDAAAVLMCDLELVQAAHGCRRLLLRDQRALQRRLRAAQLQEQA